MTEDVDTDLSEVFRAMHDSCDPTPGENPLAPKIRPIVLKGDRKKRSILPMVAILALLGIALLFLMLFPR